MKERKQELEHLINIKKSEIEVLAQEHDEAENKLNKALWDLECLNDQMNDLYNETHWIEE